MREKKLECVTLNGLTFNIESRLGKPLMEHRFMTKVEAWDPPKDIKKRDISVTIEHTYYDQKGRTKFSEATTQDFRKSVSYKRDGVKRLIFGTPGKSMLSRVTIRAGGQTISRIMKVGSAPAFG